MKGYYALEISLDSIVDYDVRFYHGSMKSLIKAKMYNKEPIQYLWITKRPVICFDELYNQRALIPIYLN